MTSIAKRLTADREPAPEGPAWPIPKARIFELSRGARPATKEETDLIEIVELFDYFGWRTASAWGKQILLERAAKIVARGLHQPRFEFKIEMAAWSEPAPVRKSFFARFRRTA